MSFQLPDSPGARAPAPTAPCVLITGAGGIAAYGYALALAQRQPQARLISADVLPRELVSAAVHAQAHRRVDPFRDDGLAVARLAALVAADQVTHWLPMVDAEAAWACRAREAIARRMPHLTVVGAAGDAAPWVAWLAEPRDALARRLEALQIEMIDEAQAVGLHHTALRHLREEPPLRLHAVDVLPDAQQLGRAHVSCREMLHERAGIPLKARIAPHDGLAAMAERLVGGWGIASPFSFQVAEGSDGHLQLLRLLPRLDAGSALSAANGCDGFAATWAQAFGGEPLAHWRPAREVAHVTRQFTELLAPAAGRTEGTRA